MKKIILTLFVVYFLYFIFYSNVYAVSPTPTKSEKQASPTEEEKNNTIIENLKTRIASRVAQLKLIEKRGVVGKVTDVSDTQITISDLKTNKRFIDVDDLTKFASPSAKEAFGISDINRGLTIGALGLYNKESQRLMARFVNVLNIPTFIHGIVKEVDKENYTVTVIDNNNQEYVVDIEQTTKTLSYSKDEDLIRSGFSKIEAGKRISIFGIPVAKNKNRLTGVRITFFKDLLPNPTIQLNSISPSETSTKSAEAN